MLEPNYIIYADISCGHPACSRFVRDVTSDLVNTRAATLGWRRHYVDGNPWRCDSHLVPSLIELTEDQLIAARHALMRAKEVPLLSTLFGKSSDTEIAKQLAPIPMLLWCPLCRTRHIDEGDVPHASHACQSCGLVWKPALVDTVGVRHLPGCFGPKEK